MNDFIAKHIWGLLGLALFITGTVMGLFVAPTEQHMGDVYRILYVHVPTAWVGMLFFFIAFCFAIASLWTGSPGHDHRMVGSLETATIFCGLLLIQGSIWAKPTWGVWWTPDVRLTTSAIMFLLLVGILAYRSYVEHREQRAIRSAVATIIAFVDVPIVYFCVKVMRTVHQTQSSPETVDAPMIVPLHINSFGLLFIAIWFVSMRARIEANRALGEDVPLPPKLVTEEA